MNKDAATPDSPAPVEGTSIAPGAPIASLSIEFNEAAARILFERGQLTEEEYRSMIDEDSADDDDSSEDQLDNEGYLDEVDDEADDWDDDDDEYVEQYDYLGEIIHSIKLYEKFSAPPGERVDHDLSTTTLNSTRLVKVSPPIKPENTPDSPSPDHPQPTGLIHSAALTRHSQGPEIIKVVVPEGSDAIPQPTDRSGEDVVEGEFWDEVSTE